MRGVSPVASSVFRSAGLKRGCMMPGRPSEAWRLPEQDDIRRLERLRVCSFRFVFFAEGLVVFGCCVFWLICVYELGELNLVSRVIMLLSTSHLHCGFTFYCLPCYATWRIASIGSIMQNSDPARNGEFYPPF